MSGDILKTCPDCETRTLAHIESTDADAGGEYKDIYVCGHCDGLVYLIRQEVPQQDTPEGMVDHDAEDRRAYSEERNNNHKPSEY